MKKIFNFLKKEKTIKEDWCGWGRLIERKPAYNMVDCNAFFEAGKIMSSLVILTIFDLGTSRNGFPTKELFKDIYEIEEKIEKIIDQNSRYAGRITTNGLEFYSIYTTKPLDIKNKLEKIAEKYKQYRYKVTVADDKEWTFYFDMLYPPLKEKQKYHTSNLIREIIQSGGNPQKEHLIDHVMLFNTKEDRSNYLKDLKNLKFPVEKHEIFDHKEIENPFSLQISIRSQLEDNRINNSINILIDLSEKYKAIYDGWGTEIVK